MADIRGGFWPEPIPGFAGIGSGVENPKQKQVALF
jgi:hypothetical protein